MPRFHINQCFALMMCLTLTCGAAMADEDAKETEEEDAWYIQVGHPW
jgi:hypothetical protein